MKQNKPVSYYVGYGIGYLLSITFRLIWMGLKVAGENIFALVTYIVLGVMAFLLFSIGVLTFNASLFGTSFLMMFLTALAIFSFGLWQYEKEAPERKRREYFYNLFLKVGLHTDEEDVPIYMDFEHVSEYTLVITFYSLIPLSEWNKVREVLEMHLNQNIIDIIQDKQDNRFIYIVIENNPLPSREDWCNTYLEYGKEMLTIGISHVGVVGMDLEYFPHAFIAGETGSGKSNILKCMIHQSLCKDYEVVLIDFKRGVSFSSFQDVVPVYYDENETLEVLNIITIETKRRLDLFREYEVESLNDYNKYAHDSLRRKIIFIDELAELLRIRDKEMSKLLYDSIETLTRLSRAAGIHLIMGIQRPDSTIISGQIKNNVSFRVCGRFVDKEPSRIMLGNDKASTLQNIKGRFIIKADDLYTVQSFYYETKASDKPRIKEIATILDQTIPEEKEAPKEVKIVDNKEPLKQSNFIFNFTDIEYKKED